MGGEKNHPAKGRNLNTLSENERWQKQIDFWQKCASSRQIAYGPIHLRTAEAMMYLGMAQISGQDFLAAGKTYLGALKIYQTLYGDFHLSVARALDKVGLAASMSHENLDLALTALSDAYRIRCALLGPNHIDSIDSLNNIAGVRLNRREFEVAANNYRVVIEHRRRVFGKYHASVAVTAYTLACILQDQLDRRPEAIQYFGLAREVYESLGHTRCHYLVDTHKRLKQCCTMAEV